MILFFQENPASGNTPASEEQERRFQARIDNPAKRWKLSPMDMQSRAKWVEYSQA